MKRFLVMLSVVALGAGAWAQALAQNNQAPAGEAMKPVAVLSIGSYDRLLADAAMLGDLAGNPGLDVQIDEMLKLFTQGLGMAGLNRQEPVGVTLVTDGLDFQPLVFLPVTNYRQLVDAFVPLVGEPVDAGGGLQELNISGQKIYLKEQPGWAFVGQSPHALRALPADPAAYLEGLDKQYDLALRLYVQNIPEVYRALAIDQLRIGVETGMGRMPEETDEQYAARRQAVQEQIATMTQAIEQVESLTLGMKFDRDRHSAFVDINTSAVPGSEAAQQLAAQSQPITSDFAGFLLPEAAVSFNSSGRIDAAQAVQAKATLATARDQLLEHLKQAPDLEAAQAKLASDIIGNVFDAVQKTIDSGKLDAGATLRLGEKSMTLVAGISVAEPQALEESLKKFVEWGKTEPNFPVIKFDAEKHGEVRFHTTSVPVPHEEKLAKVVGDKLDVAVGIGPKAIYLAVGTENLALAKQLIDSSKAASDKKLSPMQINVALAPIFQFANAVEPQPETTMLAAQLSQAQGKDGVNISTLTGSAQNKATATVRIELEEAVLRLLVNAGRMLAGQQ